MATGVRFLALEGTVSTADAHSQVSMAKKFSASDSAGCGTTDTCTPLITTADNSARQIVLPPRTASIVMRWMWVLFE